MLSTDFLTEILAGFALKILTTVTVIMLTFLGMFSCRLVLFLSSLIILPLNYHLHHCYFSASTVAHRFHINSPLSSHDLDHAPVIWMASLTSKLASVTGIDCPGCELNQPHWSNLNPRQIQLSLWKGLMWYFSMSQQKVIRSGEL